MKHCTTCNKLKQLSDFHKDGKSLDGHRRDCKTCRLEKSKNYRQTHYEQLKASRVKYESNNPNRYKEYYSANSEKVKARASLWARQNKDKANAKTARRYAAMRIPAWANKAKISNIYKMAAEMRKQGLNVHVDHIVPLRGKLVSGLHVENNLRIIDAVENIRKNNKF